MAKKWEYAFEKLGKSLGDTFELDTSDMKKSLGDFLRDGTIRNEKGKRMSVPGSFERQIKKLGEKLSAGRPLYIYKKGEDHPREVKLDGNGEITVSEPIGTAKRMEKPEKPSLIWRYLNVICRMFGGNGPYCKEWNAYYRQKSAFERLNNDKRVLARKDYNDKVEKEEKEKETEKKTLGEKDAEVTASPEKVSAEPAKENKNVSPEAQTAEKKENETLISDLISRIESMSKTIEKLTNELNELKSPNKDKNIEKEIEELGELLPADPEPEKDTEIKSTEDKGLNVGEMAKEIQTEINQEKKEAEEDKELTFKADNETDKKPVGQESEKEEERKDKAAEEKKTAENKNPEPVKKDEPMTAGKLIDMAKKLYGEEEMPENIGKNIKELWENSNKGQDFLKENMGKNKLFRGGDAVKDIVAYKKVVNGIMNNDRSTLTILQSDTAVDFLRKTTLVSPIVLHGSAIGHNDKFFQDHFLNEDGLNEIVSGNEKKMEQMLSDNNKSKTDMDKALESLDKKKGPEIKGPGNKKEKEMTLPENMKGMEKYIKQVEPGTDPLSM